MAVVTFSLQTTAPMFLNGANTREPDALRAPSVRGQLRYWFRALEGATKPALRDLWEAESGLFGSTGQGSKVSVRFYTSSQLMVEEADMLPHKSQSRDRSPQRAIKEGMRFNFDLVTRPGIDVPPRVVNTCQIWLLLGGLGKRSRRMFGSFGVDWTSHVGGLTATPQDYAALIKARLSSRIKAPIPAMPNLPDFPTLHPNHSRILVGTRGQDDHEALVRDLFGLLRSDRFRNDERSFGYAMRGRRSSPLIAQARKIGNKYYPVLTAMRSRPDKDIRWDTVKDFMNEAQRRWACVEAWGEWR